MILPAKIRRERVKLGFKFHCSFFPGEVVSDRFSPVPPHSPSALTIGRQFGSCVGQRFRAARRYEYAGVDKDDARAAILGILDELRLAEIGEPR